MMESNEIDPKSYFQAWCDVESLCKVILSLEKGLFCFVINYFLRLECWNYSNLSYEILRCFIHTFDDRELQVVKKHKEYVLNPFDNNFRSQKV